MTRPDGEPERPVGPAVDPTPARRPDAVSLSGRFGSVERLDAGRHGEPLWEALAGHDRVWTYMAYGPFADRGAFLAWLHERRVHQRPLRARHLHASSKRLRERDGGAPLRQPGHVRCGQLQLPLGRHHLRFRLHGG